MMTPAVSAQSLTWELESLRPPTAAELKLAHRVGIDPNALLVRFAEQYGAAIRKDARTIERLVREHGEACRDGLWDHLNQIAEDRREEWWVAPIEAVARLLAPGVDPREVVDLARRSRTVGMIVRVRRPRACTHRAPRQTTAPTRPAARSACRGREHRSRRSTSTRPPSPDGEPGEPAELAAGGVR